MNVGETYSSKIYSDRIKEINIQIKESCIVELMCYFCFAEPKHTGKPLRGLGELHPCDGWHAIISHVSGIVKSYNYKEPTLHMTKTLHAWLIHYSRGEGDACDPNQSCK